MASLLATQLNRLSIPEGQNASADVRRRKSLIYNEAELNKVDAAAHLERAQKAFKHLTNLDSSLEQFYDCFFSEERINFEPTMQTPQQKATLDQFVEHFLIRVSQHLLLGVTLEALEWLVYRFHIHLYNMDAMLQAVFPYHSTNLFPKFLQLFDFNSSNKRWHWLKNLANNGLPLVKSELVRVAARDESVLNFPCNLVMRALKVFGPDESRLSLFVNLYAQVTLGVLMTPIDGKALTKCVNSLNFYIVKGLRSSLKCYRHSAYQIVQLLAAKHQLNPTMLNIWIRRLLKSSCKYEPQEVCLLVALLCKTQGSVVPQQLLNKFESVCERCNATVLNEFPEIVGRDTADVDVVMPQAVVANSTEDNAEESEARKLQLQEKQRLERLEQQRQLDESMLELLLSERSPLTIVACLLTLLTSHSIEVRQSSLDCLAAVAKSAKSGDEEDAGIWSTVDTVLANRRSIERDSQTALRPEVAEASCRLLWRSIREMLQKLPVTGLHRRCLASHLQYLNEACLRVCLADGEESSAMQLARLVNYADLSVAKTAASKVTPAVFNSLSHRQKSVYLMDGLGSSQLTEEPRILKLIADYSVEKEVYMDCLAELFALVSSNPSIKNLSDRRKSCLTGNAYLLMDESVKRKVRFLFKLLVINEAEAFEDGLQLVIRLLETLKILMQAHSKNPDSSVVRDVCLCLVSADKVAERSVSDSGLADLVPAHTALECVRAVQNRQCQYAGVSLLCRLCQRAPSSVGRCFSELVEFLIDAKFFSRSDEHSDQLWHLLLDSAVPFCADGATFLRQLLSAYPDVPPSRRVELYKQAIEALGAKENLWILLLLLNMQVVREDGQRQHAQPTLGRKRRLSETRQFGQFDQLGSSVLAAFDAPLQLESCSLALDRLLASLNRGQSEESSLTLPDSEEEQADLLGGTLALVTLHLSRRDLLVGIASNEASASAMTKLLKSLVDSLLWSSVGHSRRPLAAASVRAIERAESAVPSAKFLQVVTDLLGHSEHGVRRKSLDLLLGKLSGLDKATAVRHLRKQLLACLPALERHADSQVGLICAKELTRLIGAEEAKQVMRYCAGASSRCLQFDSISWEIAGCCLLLNAEAVKQAGLAMLPVVVQTLPGLLDCLHRQQQPPQVALTAAYAFIQQCVMSLCDLLVPYLPQLIPVTVHYLEDCSPQPQLGNKLRSVLSRLGKSVEFGQLAPVVLRCADSDSKHPSQYARLLRIGVQTAAARREADLADSIDEFESELIDTFRLLLGARERQLELQESGVVQQLARCLLMLSRSTQSSLLQSLLDWSGSANARRQLALYRMLQLALANQAQLAELLAELEIGQRLSQLLEARPTNAESEQLLRLLLANLRLLFAAGVLEFEQIESIGRAAVAQLEAGDSLDAVTAGEHLLPCLSELADSAGGDETLLKPIFNGLCDLCQPNCAKLTRYWSLRSLQAMANALGEVFVDSLATDCVPTLAECAEDDDEEIEALAQEILRDIEQKAGGEPMEL